MTYTRQDHGWTAISMGTRNRERFYKGECAYHSENVQAVDRRTLEATPVALVEYISY